eukprot:TRINITY_DN73701_c0_g1_i1.p1 TRINITY_DN73701_c0_g1~~TRINITY_DN73701_c0_g1_i1.p1  ORF type:complete len:109 (+),score=10.27 TRINITY_DN73701_c0_g1_i1:43-327(+)
MDYTPPAIDDLKFIFYACCCELCALKEFECSAISEYDVICCHGSSSCSMGEIKGCIKSTGALLCFDTRCALPCDEEVPFMVGLCNVICYDSRKK